MPGNTFHITCSCYTYSWESNHASSFIYCTSKISNALQWHEQLWY